MVAVEDADGQLQGLVAEDQLWNVPEDQRATMRLTQLMIPFSRLAKADPDDDVADVLSRLNPIAPIVTVWRDGRLLGVVPAATIRNRLAAGVAGLGVLDGPVAASHGLLVAPREVDPLVGALPHVLALHDRRGFS